MATKKQLAAVQKILLARRKKLVKQGLCRDCGLNPIAVQVGKRKPTLCASCRQGRRAREALRSHRADGHDEAGCAICADLKSKLPAKKAVT
jgi:hypothetical protein